MSEFEMALKQEGVLEQCYAACARMNITLASYIAILAKEKFASTQKHDSSPRMTAEEMVNRSAAGDLGALKYLDSVCEEMAHLIPDWDEDVREERNYD